MIAGVVVVWLVAGLLPVIIFDTMAERGTFGDMFGGANALFSGLALAGVVYAILLQREELQLQRGELEMTRKELHRTAEAQITSAETLSRQYILAARTAQLQALTALLQSCNDRIAAERAKVDQSKPSMIRRILGRVPELENERGTLEDRIRLITEEVEKKAQPGTTDNNVHAK